MSKQKEGTIPLTITSGEMMPNCTLWMLRILHLEYVKFKFGVAIVDIFKNEIELAI